MQTSVQAGNMLRKVSFIMNFKKILVLIIAIVLLLGLLLAAKLLDSRILEGAGTRTHFFTPEETTEETALSEETTTIPAETTTVPAETTEETELETKPKATTPKAPAKDKDDDKDYTPLPTVKPTAPPATNPPATQPPATQPPATQPPATQAPSDNQGGREDEFPLTPIG